MFVCGPALCGPAQAGKKRREGSIDRLRDRDPSERWQLLQKMWRPLADEPEATAVSTPPVEPAVSRAESGRGAAAGSITASQVPRAEAPVEASTQFPGARSASGQPAALPQPLWVIDSDAGDAPSDLKRMAPHTQDVSHQAGSAAPQAADASVREMAAAAGLKPITDILPYRDYVPPGTVDGGGVLCTEDSSDEDCPKLDKLPEIGFEQRVFAETHVAWEASNLFSNPLYFEDASLERYGHTHGCLQPLVSVGKFGVQLVGLPYQMALHPVCEKRYALGWYRPGECAPYKYYLPPWNTKAALTAGAAYTGLIFLIP